MKYRINTKQFINYLFDYKMTTFECYRGFNNYISTHFRGAETYIGVFTWITNECK